MKRSTLRSTNLSKLPIAGREAEYALRRVNAADTCNDRVSEDIFDVDGERAELDIIVQRMIHGVH